MKKALIIYGSTTGNTEDMARMVNVELKKAGLETQLKDVTEASVDNLTDGHDLVLLGCPAYGYEAIILQEFFAEFYDRMSGIELGGKNFAVFAPGDSSYEHFCGSVDVLEDKMTELGGTKVADGLKIDGDPGDYEEEISDWAKSAAKSDQFLPEKTTWYYKINGHVIFENPDGFLGLSKNVGL